MVLILNFIFHYLFVAQVRRPTNSIISFIPTITKIIDFLPIMADSIQEFPIVDVNNNFLLNQLFLFHDL